VRTSGALVWVLDIPRNPRSISCPQVHGRKAFEREERDWEMKLGRILGEMFKVAPGRFTFEMTHVSSLLPYWTSVTRRTFCVPQWDGLNDDDGRIKCNIELRRREQRAERDCRYRAARFRDAEFASLTLEYRR